MRNFILIGVAALALTSGTAFAQSSGSGVRVAPGQVCADNKCVRFSGELRSVSIQARRSVSVANYRLAANPVISRAAFREIFRLALRQGTDSNR